MTDMLRNVDFALDGVDFALDGVTQWIECQPANQGSLV